MNPYDDFDKAWGAFKEALRHDLIDRRGWLFFLGMWIGILVGGIAVWWNP